MNMILKRLLWFYLLFSLTVTVVSGGVHASAVASDTQRNEPQLNFSVDLEDYSDSEDALKAANQQFSAIEQKLLTHKKITDDTLVGYRDHLVKIDDGLTVIKTKLTNEITTLKAQLEHVTVSIDGDQKTAIDNNGLDSLPHNMTKQLGQFELLLISLNHLQDKGAEISHRIANIRRARFSEQLFERFTFNAHEWANFDQDYSQFIISLSSSLGLWLAFVNQHKAGETLLVLLVSAFTGLLTWFFLRLFFGHSRLNTKPHNGQPPSNAPTKQGFKAHVARIVVPLSILLVMGAVNGFLLTTNDIISHRTEALYHALTINLFIWLAIERILNLVFSPLAPSKRLVNLPVKASHFIYVMVTLITTVHILGFIFSDIINIYSTSLILTQALNLTLIGVLAVSFILFGLGLYTLNVHTFRPGIALFIKLGRSLNLFVGVINLLLLLFGYIGLANVLGDIIISMVIVAAIITIIIVCADHIRTPGIMSGSRLAHILIARKLITPAGIDSVSAWSGLVIGAVLIAISLPFLMFPWYFDLDDVLAVYTIVFTDVTIGGITFSFMTLIAGLVIFFTLSAITRLAQRSFGSSKTSHHLDSGIRDSLRRGIGYIGYSFAVIMAIVSTGLDLSNLAIVAGALSLGVGFGLQNIVSNFVSGLILLIERPIKVGDWVVIDQHEGKIKNISVRATQIETFDGQAIFIPNAKLINDVVGNWHYGDKRGRISVPITISRDADIDKIKAILLDIGQNHEQAMSTPSPCVVLQDIQGNAYLLELRVHIFDIDYGIDTVTDLRLTILNALKEEDIDVPHPCVDININPKSLPVNPPALSS